MSRTLGLTASAFQALTSVLLIVASTLLISRAATHVPIMMLMTLVVLVRAFAIGRASFRYAERLLLHNSAFDSLAKTRNLLFQKLEPIAPVGLRLFNRGDLVSRMVEDVEDMQNLTLRVLPAIVQAVTSVLVATAFFAVVSLPIAIATFGTMAATLAIALIISLFTGSKGQQNVATERATLYSQLVDAAERSQVLVAYGWSAEVHTSIQNQSNRVGNLEKRAARANGLSGALLVAGIALTQTIAGYLGASAVLSGAIDRTYLAALILTPVVVFESFQLALFAVPAFKRYQGSKTRIDAILSHTGPVNHGDLEIKSFESLELKNAKVSYEGGLQIDFPDLKVKPGTNLALLGRSGSGKTSLANILVGFTQPTSGEFLLNGVKIENFTFESLRQVVGLVEQDPKVLLGSVEDNLKIAKPDASEKELVDVLKRVGLWSMLMDRAGLQTQVGENGKNLSGGEASRLALARVILANRSLVILDEPSAALDRELAHELVSDLLRITQRESDAVILITHDPELAKLCEESAEF